jgi:pimeloyl-ACP methyl ester carboxylesterase
VIAAAGGGADAPRAPVRVGTVETPDGAQLRYRIDGPLHSTLPPLLCSNGLGVATFFFHHLAARFSRTRAVITWDYRGHGQSPPPPDADGLTVARCARDLWLVADACGAQRPVLIGHSMGCQVLLEATRLQPARPSALVPMLGVAGRALSSFFGGSALEGPIRIALELGAQRPDLVQRLTKSVLATPGMWTAVRTLGLVHPDLCPREEFVPYFEHLGALDWRSYFALARDLVTHDASDLLEGLRLPVLVVAGERDLFTPMRRSEEMARAIAGARLLVVPEGSHAALIEQPVFVGDGLEKFLRDHALA